MSNDDLFKPARVIGMLQNNKVVISLDNAYDVGTVVIVADSYFTRTLVYVFAGTTHNTALMVACNDGMAKSHDGAHDCQVP